MGSLQVVVTGASGRTGKLVVQKLIEKGHKVLAGVRSEAKANELRDTLKAPDLECPLIDLGAANAATQMAAALKGADALMICTSASPKIRLSSLPGAIFAKMLGGDAKPSFWFEAGASPKQVDYEGCLLQINAAKEAGIQHVVLLSSMAGTDPQHFLNVSMEKIVLWKRQAEMALIASGLTYTIVHPGGLLPHAGPKPKPAPGGERALAVSVNDEFMTSRGADDRMIPREDVATVLVQTLTTPEARGRSFDVVSDPPGKGAPYDGDLTKLLSQLNGKNCSYDSPDLDKLLAG